MWASLSLCVARMSLTAWIGAAVLFVIVGVREVMHPELTSEVKDVLAVTRFPAYYACGATLLAVSGAALLGCRKHPALTTHIAALSLALIATAALTMLADYVWIYRPLAALITPPGQPRTQQFLSLHKWSQQINTLQLMLCLIAAALLQWPRRPPATLEPPAV